MFSWLSGGKKAKEAAPAPDLDAEPPHPQPAPAPAPVSATAPKIAEMPEMPRASSSLLSERSMKQFGLFAAGASFMMLSTLVTRRAVARKTIVPTFYQQSTRPPTTKPEGKDPLIAVEALGLATLNVFSFAIMATGGLAWAFDVSTVEELRTKARKHMYGPAGRIDEAAEQEVAEWAARVLASLEGKKKKEEDAKGAGRDKED
ncbi:hypothetical protein NKR23_g1822 [Pleurostoma richardsiae]|uniref:Altered inheritance of mitochondria protein 11 n=1 Tax=Pleurostoma richardsiae TaxID=41990 RepID=A0AA38S327_9PEZI|nr:hypothetical protein NKR23_g1822 [Pleurostoma richardsiae]